MSLLSIITVVYNGKKEIVSTFNSFLNIGYTDVEYIVVDGASIDGTVGVIEKYESIFNEHGIVFKWISEEDNGIYDAMNKGIEMSTGTWVNFMNAGDEFHPDLKLNKFFDLKHKDKIYFGKSISTYKNIEKIRYKDFHLENPNWYLNYMPNHQAVFLPLAFCKRNKYDLNLNYYSDTLFLRKAFSCMEYEFKDSLISIFSIGGVSTYYGSIKNLIKILNDVKCLETNVVGRGVRSIIHILKYFVQIILGRDKYLKFYITKILKEE